MPENQVPKVKRIRRVAVATERPPLPEGTHRGFGAQGHETDEQFQERMFALPALEAALYEMERDLRRDIEKSLDRADEARSYKLERDLAYPQPQLYIP